MKQPLYSIESTEPPLYVVYDKRDLQIIHIHQFLAAVDAVTPSQAEIEYDACELANRITGKSISEMAVIHIPEDDLKIGVEYDKVDLDNKCLLIKQETKNEKGQQH
jgi:hypothetical protein